jgi:hypothetical protein
MIVLCTKRMAAEGANEHKTTGRRLKKADELAGEPSRACVRARARKRAMSLTLLPLQDCQRRPSHPDERAAGANLALLG